MPFIGFFINKRKGAFNMKTRKHFIAMVFVAIIALAFAVIGCKQDASPTPIANMENMEYKLGDTGPGGGKIFYVSKTGFTMTDNNQLCHYLEAASSDQGSLVWGSTATHTTTTNIVGTGTAIGTGRKNTALILATDSDAPAAKACHEYTGGGKSDWFLPSKDELNELYKNRTSIGNLESFFYWSSSQGSPADTSWRQNFSNGDQDSNFGKGSAYSVRAVRAF
jgi:hypothetical protein